jgi:hypothetical protein
MADLPEFELPAVANDAPSSPIIRPSVEQEIESCGMCTAYLPNAPGSKFGACCANPPVPMLVGMGQGLDGKPRPIVDGYRAPVGFNTQRCRDSFERITAETPSLYRDFVTEGGAQ